MAYKSLNHIKIILMATADLLLRIFVNQDIIISILLFSSFLGLFCALLIAKI